MQIFYELNKNPKLSLVLGFFDGVHLGHKKVIKSAVDYAKQHNCKSAVITFKDHPCCYLWNLKPQYILEQKNRENLIASMGIDYLYELDFKSISDLSAQEYLENILIDNFKPISVSTGWNHNFGHNKSGNCELLKENSKKHGYEYFELSPQKIGDEIISSTAIRKYLQSGKIENANAMLGYNFFVEGQVIKGNQIGRTIGYKTANIEYPTELIEIPYGVYSSVIKIHGLCEEACRRCNPVNSTVDNVSGLPRRTINCTARNDDIKYKAIANYGLRPTVNGSKPVLEVHILDFDEDIYGETITVEFIRMLRPERKFNSLDELKKQIDIDLKSI